MRNDITIAEKVRDLIRSAFNTVCSEENPRMQTAIDEMDEALSILDSVIGNR